MEQKKNRQRPTATFSLLPETKDLIDTLSMTTGLKKSRVVDKLLSYLAEHHKVEDFVSYMLNDGED